MNFTNLNLRLIRIIIIWFIVINAFPLTNADADDFVPLEEETITQTDSDFLILDNDNTATWSTFLQFGNSLNKKLTFDITSSWFNFNDSLTITGGLSIEDKLNFNQNEANNLVLENSLSAPINPVQGQIYYNSADQNTYIWNGISWTNLSTSTGSTATWSDLAATQTRRSTAFNIPNTWSDITFDQTDVEIDSTVIEHDTTNTDRVLIKQDGLYQISYHLALDVPTDPTGSIVDTRVRSNDTSVINGSIDKIFTFQYNALTYNGHSSSSPTFVTNLTAGDFLSLQLQSSVNVATLTNSTLTVVKLDGIKGADGTLSGGTNDNILIIDQDDNGNPQVLSFGSAITKILSFDRTNDWFNLTDRLNIAGDGNTNGVKLTTRAGASDSEQNQIEIRNNANITVFGVDEDGDISLAGTVDGVDVSNLETRVNTNETDITNLQTNVSTNSNNITNLQTDVGTLRTDLNTHTGSTSNPHQVTLEQARSQNNQILGNIDFNQNEAEKLVFEKIASNPVSATGGQVYYNTNKNAPYFYDGTTWKNLFTDTGSLAAVQARRNTNFTLTNTNTWYDVPLPLTDIENNTGALVHNRTNTERIDIKSDGVYLVTYHLDPNDNGVTHTLNSRVMINNNLLMSGSYIVNRDYQGEHIASSPSIIANLQKDDYITLQAERTTANELINETMLNIVKLDGVKGEKGEKGDQGDPGTPGGGIPANVFYGYDSTGGQSITGTQIVVNLDNSVITDSNYTLLNDEVTTNTTGVYAIDYNITAEVTDTSGGLRGDIETAIQLDTGTGFNDIAGSLSGGYIRETTNRSSGSSGIIVSLNAGDKIRIRVRRTTGSTNINTLQNASNLRIQQLR